MSDSTVTNSPVNEGVSETLLPEFGTLEALECRGRLVFLRTDPSLVTTAAGSSVELPSDSGSESTAKEPTRESILGKGACAATLRRLLELEARVVIGTHLTGRLVSDEGISTIEELGLRLSEQLQLEVLVPDECAGDALKMVTGDLRDGQVCLLPDLADSQTEVGGDESFARALSTYFDSYVGDAFAASHRKYSSLTQLPRLCARRAMGLNARLELHTLQRWLSSAAKTRTLIVGGQHFSEKIDLIDELLPRLGALCLTGGVANTALAATGLSTGNTPVDRASLARARTLLTRARDLGVKVYLPADVVVSQSGQSQVVSANAIPSDAVVSDLGPESIAAIEGVLARASAALVWGPAGDLAAASGRAATLSFVRQGLKSSGPLVVVGESLREFLLTQKPEAYASADWISTGSQSAKIVLARGTLPGIEALRSGH